MQRHVRHSDRGIGAEDPIPARVSVALEEYRALRDEIIASLSMQQAVLSFSTLALGGLSLAGFRAVGREGDDSVALVIFLLALPLVSYVSLLIWLGEYARTTRAGLFLSELEQRVNAWVGSETLTWERFLRTRRECHGYPQYAWNVWAMFLFYAAVPLGSLGVATWPGDFGETWLWFVYAAELALWFALVARFSGGVFWQALADATGNDPSERGIWARFLVLRPRAA